MIPSPLSPHGWGLSVNDVKRQRGDQRTSWPPKGVIVLCHDHGVFSFIMLSSLGLERIKLVMILMPLIPKLTHDSPGTCLGN